MALPVIALPFRKIELGGQEVLVKGLTRTQVHGLRGFEDDLSGAEALTICFATGVTKEEAAEWLANTPQADADLLLNTVLELSGLADGQGKD